MKEACGTCLKGTEERRAADLGSVVSEPVISLSEIVEDDAAAVAPASREHDGGGGICLAGHPRRVEGVRDQEESHDQDHSTGDLQPARQGGKEK